MTDPVAPDAHPTQPRHVHPVTPLVKVATYLPVIFFGVFVSGLQSVLGNVGGMLGLAAAVILIGLIALGYEALAYRRFRFWFDSDGDLRVQSGVMFHQDRRLQLSRLQTVDINRPLMARVFGFSSLRIEVAGGGDSRADLQYLTTDEASALRAEVLARSAGLTHDAGEAPEQHLYRVPSAHLAKSLMLRTSTVMVIALTAVIIVSTVMTAGPAGLGAVLLTGLPIVIVFSEFSTLFNFTIAESPDGIRLRHGLLQTKAQTIPPGRVCAVEVVEPLLWRSRNWVRLYVTVAGVTKSDDDSGTESVLLPVATRDVADLLMERVMPNARAAEVALERAPARVTKRSPVQGKLLAVGANDNVAVFHRGRITRRTQIVDHARVQSARLTRGPWEKALGLATMEVDLPPGRIKAKALHFDAEQARELLESEIVRARAARAADRSTHWMFPADVEQPPPPADAHDVTP